MRNIQIEPRECNVCGQVYDWNMRNMYGLCVPCRKRHYTKKNRLKAHEYKKPYPLTDAEKARRYRNILKDLDGAKTKEERRAIYSRELEYMIQTGIWEWCIDLRFSTKTIEPGGKVGRPAGQKTNLPDTRGWYE